MRGGQGYRDIFITDKVFTHCHSSMTSNESIYHISKNSQIIK